MSSGNYPPGVASGTSEQNGSLRSAQAREND